MIDWLGRVAHVLLPNVLKRPDDLWDATVETLYMTAVSALIAGVLGIVLGTVLVVTDRRGIGPHPRLYWVLDKLVNLFRSIPFVILIALVGPLTRIMTGTTIGTTAALVPLVIGTVPFYARQIQNAVLEVDPGVVEAAQAMGSSPMEIIFRVYLREARPGIIRVSALTIISLIGLTTMAGIVGGGGLGDLAISRGYNRFQNDVTVVCTLIILVLVYVSQAIADLLVKRVTH